MLLITTSYCILKYTIAKITLRASSYSVRRKYLHSALAIPSISHFLVFSIVGEAWDAVASSSPADHVLCRSFSLAGGGLQYTQRRKTITLFKTIIHPRTQNPTGYGEPNTQKGKKAAIPNYNSSLPSMRQKRREWTMAIEKTRAVH